MTGQLGHFYQSLGLKLTKQYRCSEDIVSGIDSSVNTCWMSERIHSPNPLCMRETQTDREKKGDGANTSGIYWFSALYKKTKKKNKTLALQIFSPEFMIFKNNFAGM